MQARIMQLSFWTCCQGSSPPWVQALGLPAPSRQHAGQEGWLHRLSTLQARRRTLEISGGPFGERDAAAWAGLGLPWGASEVIHQPIKKKKKLGMKPSERIEENSQCFHYPCSRYKFVFWTCKELCGKVCVIITRHFLHLSPCSQKRPAVSSL